MPKTDKFTLFEYLYRDASNYKAYGELLLRGSISSTDSDMILSRLDSGERLEPEQLDIPLLYGALWALSSGPTADDLLFHEFVQLRAATDFEITSLPVWGSVDEFVEQFRRIDAWACQLSLNRGVFVA